jgi:hypothetical protein
MPSNGAENRSEAAFSISWDQSKHPFPRETLIIIGSGSFGSRAAEILSAAGGYAPILLVDRDAQRLGAVAVEGIIKIHKESTDFLAETFPYLHPSSMIVPAVPLHLALEFLKISKGIEMRSIPVPEGMQGSLPFVWNGEKGTLLLSYADFRCPEHCSEPEDCCTVTGVKRELPLYRLLAERIPLDYRGHILRSRQLAPGVGGYRVEDLLFLENLVRKEGGKWLVGTACRCHGVLSAVHVSRPGPA